jgi:DNA-binding NarL/FixJ family response regulator
MEKIRIILVDDQELILDGLKIIIESEDTFEVVAIAKDGAEALNKILLFKPDIALLDIRMPDMNGVECCRRIKEKLPEIKILMLTTFDDQDYIVDAFRYGACGYLLKDITREKLFQSIKDAIQGELILPSKVAVKLVQSVSMDKVIDRDQFDFSQRELEIASLLAQGFTNKQIATTLTYSEGTVKNTVSSIYSKIDIYDRASTAIYLKENGF